MKKTTPFAFVAGAALIGLVGQASAQQLSLKALLDLSSSVASKVEQPIQDAPGVITVYTKADVRRLGYYTLSDLADITAGYGSTRIYAERGFETRGQGSMNSAYDNNNHLVLVDGIPVNHARSNKAPANEDFPIHFAKRVEFLKGPASALYGTSAFFGVINVVTDEVAEGSASEARASVGDRFSDNVKLSSSDDGSTGEIMRQFLAHTSNSNSNGTSSVSFGYYGKNASKMLANPGGNSQFNYGKNLDGSSASYQDDNHLYWDDNSSLFLRASHKVTDGAYKGLGLGFIHYTRTSGMGEFWMAPFSHEINEVTWTTTVPYIKYEREINDQISINSYAKANYSTEKATVEGWFGPGLGYKAYDVDTTGKVTGRDNIGLAQYSVPVMDFEGLFEGRWNKDKHSLIAGVNYDYRYQMKRTDGAYTIYAASQQDTDYTPFRYADEKDVPFAGIDPVKTLSFYSQYGTELPLLQGTLLTLGVREDMASYKDLSFNQLSPRVAVVQKITPEINVKFLWGGALKAPGLKEYGLNGGISARKEAVAKSATETAENKAAWAAVDPNLDAETIQSFEGGLTFVNGNVFASASGFLNKTENKIAQKSLGGNNFYVNLPGVVTAVGGEFDAQVAVNENLRFLGNFSYAKAVSDQVDADKYQLLSGDTISVSEARVLDVPEWKANLGVNYNISGIAANVLYHVNSGYIQEKDGTLREDNKFGSNLINTVDASLGYDLSENLNLTVGVRNLLDEAYFLPWTLDRGDEKLDKVVAMPNNTPMPGRTIQLSLTSKF